MSRSGSSVDQNTKGNKASQDCSQEAPDVRGLEAVM